MLRGETPRFSAKSPAVMGVLRARMMPISSKIRFVLAISCSSSKTPERPSSFRMADVDQALACNAGHADQAHLTHDVRRLAGITIGSFCHVDARKRTGGIPSDSAQMRTVRMQQSPDLPVLNCWLESVQTVGSYCRSQTFTNTALNDQLWSIFAGSPFHLITVNRLPTSGSRRRPRTAMGGGLRAVCF